MEAVLRPMATQRYLNGNTALVSDHKQAVHADLEWRHPYAPFALTLSIFTVATTSKNGTTEFWLGSHRNTSWADHNLDSESAFLGTVCVAHGRASLCLAQGAGGPACTPTAYSPIGA